MSTMQDWIMIAFTGTIAVATIFYTVFTRRLWRITKRSVDIARYTTMVNYVTLLSAEIEKSKQSDPSAAKLLEAMSAMVVETGVESMLDEVDFRKEPKLARDYRKIEEIVRSHGVDPRQVPWFRPILERLDHGK